jgi:acetyl-CoA C-acetyltransferase
MTQRVYIVAAKRTPIGRFMGALSKRSATELAIAASKATLAGVDAAIIDQVIVGNVLSAGLGMNVARQVGIGAGLLQSTPAYTVNMMCASGLQAVALASQAIRAGDANVVLCGGTESMTNAPYLLQKARAGYKFGDGSLVDSVLRDGLTCAFDNEHMGLGAERLAKRFNITRAEQDAFAALSQQRAGRAMSDGSFTSELINIDAVTTDEHPRPDTTAEKLATLKPAFDPAGSVTAGNASGVNDGSAMLLVASENAVTQHSLKPLAEIAGFAAAGCDPAFMGLGPVHATRLLCDKLRISVSDIDTVELNEAFAAQSLSCVLELGLSLERVNLHGGAIALGHPIGASGARLVTHLAHRIAAGQAETALATLCVGGGMGVAMLLRAV